jgi:hypothetical protein
VRKLARSSGPLLRPDVDHHPVADDHRDMSVPHGEAGGRSASRRRSRRSGGCWWSLVRLPLRLVAGRRITVRLSEAGWHADGTRHVGLISSDLRERRCPRQDSNLRPSAGSPSEACRPSSRRGRPDGEVAGLQRAGQGFTVTSHLGGRSPRGYEARCSRAGVPPTPGGAQNRNRSAGRSRR